MLSRAKAGEFAYPAINVSSSQTLERGVEGLRRRWQRRDHPGLDRWRRIPVRADGEGHGGRICGVRRLRPRGRQELPGEHRPAHRPLPEGQAGQASSGRCWPSPRSGSRAARSRCSSRTCGTVPRCRWTRTCRSPRSCWPSCAAAKVVLEIEVGVVGGEEDGVVGEISDEALQHHRGRAGHGGRARHWARRASTWRP